jgi:hypothetical protein
MIDIFRNKDTTVVDRYFSDSFIQHDVIVIRYADDSIVGFQHEHEAKAFLHDLQERMWAHGHLQQRRHARTRTPQMRQKVPPGQ